MSEFLGGLVLVTSWCTLRFRVCKSPYPLYTFSKRQSLTTNMTSAFVPFSINAEVPTRRYLDSYM